MSDRITVQLLKRLVDPVTGGQWNPGEWAGFAPVVAADLIARGIAKRMSSSEPEKAPAGAPRDTMVRHAGVKKGGSPRS